MSLDRQLELLRQSRNDLQSEKEQRTAELRAQINKIEAEYATRERGIQKAIEGLEEATGHRFPLSGQTQTESTKIRIQDALEQILKSEPGKGFTARDLARRVREIGGIFESSNPEHAASSSMYALIAKYKKINETPIRLVGTKTWAWVSPA